MKIGIIVFSYTGHTLSVAETLQKNLAEAGHEVRLEQIAISGEASPGKFNITNITETEPYEGIVFASPVQAFSLNPVMNTFLRGIPSLQEKKVALLITKQLPFYWTGGNRALRTMSKICKSKGAKILGSGIVIWSQSKREQTKKESINRIVQLFAANL